MLPARMNPPQNVLITLDAVGGVWRYAVDLARGLGAIGIRTTLLGFGPPPSRDREAEVEEIDTARLVWSEHALDWMAGHEDELAGIAPRDRGGGRARRNRPAAPQPPLPGLRDLAQAPHRRRLPFLRRHLVGGDAARGASRGLAVRARAQSPGVRCRRQRRRPERQPCGGAGAGLRADPRSRRRLQCGGGRRCAWRAEGALRARSRALVGRGEERRLPRRRSRLRRHRTPPRRPRTRPERRGIQHPPRPDAR